jgi:hypothetical protein
MRKKRKSKGLSAKRKKEKAGRRAEGEEQRAKGGAGGRTVVDVFGA